MSLVLPYRDVRPAVAERAFIADNATLVGDVTVGDETSVWYGTVIRGDVMPIRIGARTSIQDNSVIHATGGWSETRVGDDVTVGHAVLLHGCTIADRVLVGMGSIVLDAAEIGPDVILGAGSLVTTETTIPPGVLALGRPAKPKRDLRPDELEQIRDAARIYVEKTHEYRAAQQRR
jgi:carbonic anhydrase/acetyltransferase-like protein (isoleucine patch superfamily)